jgi:myo-inositol 2-dehydrogenase/D-chiro-inositol 1-dehydrogenase
VRKGHEGVRLGLVGCGEVSFHKHLPGLQRVPGMKVVAVADVDPAKASWLAQRYGIQRQFRSVEQLLAGVEVDAIGVCVPPCQHYEVAAPALRAGKHVWIDKPLALDANECLRIREEVCRSDGKVMVGFHMRWHRLVLAAIPVIRSGRLGRIESIRSIWNSPRKDEGIPEWRLKRATGGGALIEIGVHHYDLWRFLLGTGVRSVFARSRDATRDDEAAIVTAELDNGVLASASLSERTCHEVEVEICGDRGRLRLSLCRFEGMEQRSVRDLPGSAATRLKRMKEYALSLPAAFGSLRHGSDYMDSYRGAWEHFANAIGKNGAVECTLEDGIRATEVVLAVTESRERGEPAVVRKLALPGSTAVCVT